MKALRIIGIVVLAFLAACTNTPEPSPSQTPTPTPTATTPSPTPTATSSPLSAQRIVYTIGDRETSDRSRWEDVYLYDVAADRVTRLTRNGTRFSETVARFHGNNVTFIVDHKDLVELDPASKTRHRLLRAAGQLGMYAWSPDGNEVAYIESLTTSARRLRVFNVTTKTTTTLKDLGTLDGRGTGDFDSVTIAWNHAGDRILVNDSYQEKNPTLRFIRRKGGGDIIRPINNAINAILSADERSIYLLNVSATGTGGNGAWQRLDLATQKRRTLALRSNSFHAALSPDGTHLAATTFDFQTKAHAIWVLDLTKGTQVRLAKGYRDAVWLDDETVAPTRVVACSSGVSCEYNGYRASGTRRVTLTRSVSPLRLGSTMWDGLGTRNADVDFA